jgi:hypothetical protein
MGSGLHDNEEADVDDVGLLVAAALLVEPYFST